MGKSKRKKSVDSRQSKDIKKLKEQVSLMTEVIETKFKDNTVNYPGIGSLPQLDGITELLPWDTTLVTSNRNRNISREGNSVVVKSYRMQGMLTLPQLSTGIATNCRVRIIVAHSPCALPSDYLEIMQSQRIDSFKKIKPLNPYRILYDKTFNLQNVEQRKQVSIGTNTSTSTEPFRRHVSINLKFPKGLVVQWQQDSSLAVPAMGGFTMYMISDLPTTGPPATLTSFPVLTGYSRLRYQDL